MRSLSTASLVKIAVGASFIIFSVILTIVLAVVLTRDHCSVPEEEITNNLQLNVIANDYNFWISWADVPPIGTCYVRYSIKIETDHTSITGVTPSNFFLITRDYFCFFIKYEIAVMMGSSTGLPIYGSALYGIPPVEYLGLSRSMENDKLIATWQEHTLQKQCSLQYIVTYEHGSTFYTYTVNEAIVLFNMAYCADTTVGVRILHNDKQSEEKNVTYAAEYPTSIDRAENVVVRRSETSAIVSWNSHPAFTECNVLYTVLAEHESGQSNTCQGASSCEVFLDNFCPTSHFTIFPTTDPENLSKWEYMCDGYLKAI